MRGHTTVEGVVTAETHTHVVLSTGDSLATIPKSLYRFASLGRNLDTHDTVIREASDDGAPKSKTSASPGGIDVNMLPPTIKAQVVGVTELKDTDVNNILAAVGDAARGALKDAGVSEVDLYAIVDEIMAATKPVLAKPKSKGEK